MNYKRETQENALVPIYQSVNSVTNKVREELPITLQTDRMHLEIQDWFWEIIFIRRRLRGRETVRICTRFDWIENYILWHVEPLLGNDS
jgi:hypothetical protein